MPCTGSGRLVGRGTGLLALCREPYPGAVPGRTGVWRRGGGKHGVETSFGCVCNEIVASADDANARSKHNFTLTSVSHPLRTTRPAVLQPWSLKKARLSAVPCAKPNSCSVAAPVPANPPKHKAPTSHRDRTQPQPFAHDARSFAPHHQHPLSTPQISCLRALRPRCQTYAFCPSLTARQCSRLTQPQIKRTVKLITQQRVMYVCAAASAFLLLR